MKRTLTCAVLFLALTHAAFGQGLVGAPVDPRYGDGGHVQESAPIQQPAGEGLLWFLRQLARSLFRL